MAGNRGPASEYAGTEIDGGELGDGVIPGPSGPIDPASIGGAGNGGGNSGDEFDPAIHVGRDKRNSDGSYTRKRGRKAGNGGSHRNKASSSDIKGSIDALAKTLVIVHAGLAAVSNVPEIAIDKDEGEMLANASANVLSQFDLTPDPKVQAIIGLIMACGVVYAPRVLMFKARMEQQRKEQATGEAGIYGADGQPLGTTPFSVVNNPPSQVG